MDKFNIEWKKIIDAMLIKDKWHQLKQDFEDISYETAKNLCNITYKHAAHAFLWCKNLDTLWDLNLNASILMQMRFDGQIG
jgi:hypothetical protein